MAIDCEACRATYRAYHETDENEPEHPPCGPDNDITQCDQFTELIWPENVAVFHLWKRVRHQHIMGPAGAVDLNLGTVFEAVRAAGYEDVMNVSDLLHRVYGEVLAAVKAGLKTQE